MLRSVKTFLATSLLLVGSNIFMTLAWYGHLKWLDHRVWYVAVGAAWGIALFEYSLQVPANRLGFGVLSLPQLKILQEVISLAVFVPVTGRLFHLRFRWDFVWAGFCLLGAVFFAFRGGFDGRTDARAGDGPRSPASTSSR
jgi:uncharacterized protein (DUF486 family)